MKEAITSAEVTRCFMTNNALGCFCGALPGIDVMATEGEAPLLGGVFFVGGSEYNGNWHTELHR